jgi:molybdenum cofactor cytidylyltransferase
MQVVGILLAAGKGERFDPQGKQDKLLQSLPHGGSVGVAAARHLLAAVPSVLAIVRPGAQALAAQLRALGCTVEVCPHAEQGMGVTLAFALTQVQAADGWLIALADMPYVQPATMAALAAALGQGADIAAPFYQGRRGNPVGFSRRHLPQLLGLGGDRGARALLDACPVMEIAVDDAGVLRDIDTVDDLI